MPSWKKGSRNIQANKTKKGDGMASIKERRDFK